MMKEEKVAGTVRHPVSTRSRAGVSGGGKGAKPATPPPQMDQAKYFEYLSRHGVATRELAITTAKCTGKVYELRCAETLLFVSCHPPRPDILFLKSSVSPPVGELVHIPVSDTTVRNKGSIASLSLSGSSTFATFVPSFNLSSPSPGLYKNAFHFHHRRRSSDLRHRRLCRELQCHRRPEHRKHLRAKPVC